jgi:hypothetical protein
MEPGPERSIRLRWRCLAGCVDPAALCASAFRYVPLCLPLVLCRYVRVSLAPVPRHALSSVVRARVRLFSISLEFVVRTALCRRLSSAKDRGWTRGWMRIDMSIRSLITCRTANLPTWRSFFLRTVPMPASLTPPCLHNCLGNTVYLPPAAAFPSRADSDVAVRHGALGLYELSYNALQAFK